MKKQIRFQDHRIILSVFILLVVILSYVLITAAGIISFSEKDETKPADAAIVLGASVYDNSPSLYRSWKTKLPFLAREEFYYMGYRLTRLFKSIQY